MPNQEILFEDKLCKHREKHLPLEFLLPKNGKKFMNNKKIRALQSKINLKFPLASTEKDPKKIMKT